MPVDQKWPVLVQPALAFLHVDLIRTLWCSALVVLASGCATRCTEPANARTFVFRSDTFAYSNQVYKEKVYDAPSGKVRASEKADPDYALRCFVMARSAREFFQFATFDASRPKTDDETYRKLIREVIRRDPMQCGQRDSRVVIPGFANLYQFSEAKTKLLQDTCGSQWQSYFQRGHWRMMLPFSGSRRAREARLLALEAKNRRPPVIHVVSIPKLDINHAVLIYGVRETASKIEFQTYDPNDAHNPLVITFDHRDRSFVYPRTPAWSGGKVNVYEIYRAKTY